MNRKQKEEFHLKIFQTLIQKAKTKYDVNKDEITSPITRFRYNTNLYYTGKNAWLYFEYSRWIHENPNIPFYLDLKIKYDNSTQNRIEKGTIQISKIYLF